MPMRAGVPYPSNRSDVPPFYVMEVMRAAETRERSGREVLHLEVGQPSTGAPAAAAAAVIEALGSGPLGYTGAAGMPELRQRIGRWYRDRHRIEVAPERIVVTTGASGAFTLLFIAAFDPGDRVAVLEPGYPCYRNDLLALGIDVVAVPVGADTGYRPTVELLEEAGPVDGVVVASPSNPTGTVLHDEHLAPLLDWAGANDVIVVADEIYHGIDHDRPAPTALAHDDSVIVVNSFSKYFSMTGWRLGWIVAPEPMAATIERLAQSLTIAPPTVSQVAGLAAMDCVAELDANVDRYRANRRILLDGLLRAGIDRLAPADGAFYLWADVSHLTDDSQALCRLWLDQLGVATTPGIDFDPVRGHRFVRFSYAGATEAMTEAMARLVRWAP